MPTPEEIEAARLAALENTPNADDIDPDTIDTDENISDEDEIDADAKAAKVEDDEDDEEFSISLTDDEDDDIDGDDEYPDDEPDQAKSKDSSVIREMRKKVKKLEREKKALERKHQAAETGNELPELGEKPTLESMDFDEEKFEPALVDYLERKRAHDAAAEEIKTKSEALQTAHEGRLTAYATRKAEIAETRDDIVDAEETVKSALSVTMQGVFMTVADDPALLILALGKYPKRLEKLGAISDPLILAKEVVKLEGSLNVRGKSSSKTQPEKRMKRGTAATNGVSDTKLKQLQAKADKTGNRSELQAYQRELAKAKK